MVFASIDVKLFVLLSAETCFRKHTSDRNLYDTLRNASLKVTKALRLHRSRPSSRVAFVNLISKLTTSNPDFVGINDDYISSHVHSGVVQRVPLSHDQGRRKSGHTAQDLILSVDDKPSIFGSLGISKLRVRTFALERVRTKNLNIGRHLSLLNSLGRPSKMVLPGMTLGHTVDSADCSHRGDERWPHNSGKATGRHPSPKVPTDGSRKPQNCAKSDYSGDDRFSRELSCSAWGDREV
mmetsp:Transcript_26159/g.41386  ORF Transcript_26159/g.41386 Transcript_26159/m.41386 type:complete len:238 (+) Transcript_26159:245-958(+)